MLDITFDIISLLVPAFGVSLSAFQLYNIFIRQQAFDTMNWKMVPFPRGTLNMWYTSILVIYGFFGLLFFFVVSVWHFISTF